MHRHALALRAAGEGRAIRAEKLHLTLVFLGAVARHRMVELEAIARTLMVDAFELTLDHAGLWPRQHVAWLAPHVLPSALSHLVTGLETALRAANFAVEDPAWRAHVTLLRDARSLAPLSAPQLQWQARDFVLVESAGGVYRIVSRWPLRIT